MLDALRTDVRHAFRQIARHPGFAAAVLGTLALTIGATTALFSLYNALVLRSLPVAAASRIVLVQPVTQRGQNRPLYHETYVELAKLPVFEHLALYSGGGLMLNEARGVRAEGLIEAVTPGFFEALGIQPHLGRFFTRRDFDDIASPNVVISFAMWQSLFAGDPAAIGERIVIDAHPMTVIGVTPPAFKGFYVDRGFGFSVPLTVLNQYLGTDATRPLRGLQAVGRLRDGVSIEQAQAAVQASWPSLRRAAVPARLPAAERREIAESAVKVESLSRGFSTLRTRYARPVTWLFAATVVLLAIGCVNLSGLFLARTAARDRQFAVLQALGAPRWRFVQQAMVESVVLSLLGAAMALPLAWWGTMWLTSTIWTSREPIALRTSPDARVVVTMIAVAVATGLAMAALPAARAARRRYLALGAARSVAQPIGVWGRGLLVLQIALSLVLVAGAGVFARSLWNLGHLDAGFAHGEVRWTRLFGLPGADRPADMTAHYTTIVRQIESLPHIESVSLNTMFPSFFASPQFLTRHPVTREDVDRSGSSVDNALMEFITPRFFETMGIARLRGRDVTWSDAPGAPRVALISQSLARALFGDGDAVGQRIRVGADASSPAAEVIGVVANAAIGDLREPDARVVYFSRLQGPMQVPVLLYRTRSDVAQAEADVERVIAAGRYDYARGWATVAQSAEAALVQDRVLASLSSFLAAMAALLAGLGVHGLLAFAVTQRAREIGIRMALGAAPARVRRSVVGEALALATAGAGMGLVAAVYAGHGMSSLVFGVAPADPSILAASALFFVIVAVVAVSRPARRAASLDPAITLRAD